MDLIKLHKVKQFAVEQLKKWELTGSHGNDWCFVWDTRAVRRYGQCRYHKQEISVSKQLANINSIEESKDVVLHEIAHALAGRGQGHNAVWRRMCMRVGARPERCYTSEDQGGGVKQVTGKYKLINKETGKVYKQYYRKPKHNDWSQRWIVGKKAETEGKLQVVRA